MPMPSEREPYLEGRIPTPMPSEREPYLEDQPYQPLRDPMDIEARRFDEQKQYANQLGMRPMFTPTDESQYMKKVFKSLLEAAEEKGKEQE
tara:strand:- start:314 stop:586 length:273 start_codon:yes stop_codon:yes gene_type:complete